ncbi:hypothetical protein D3C81_2258350 [compost metagenome]
MCLARGDERALQQIHTTAESAHFQLQIPAYRQHPLRIVMAFQPGGLEVAAQVAIGAGHGRSLPAQTLA